MKITKILLVFLLTLLNIGSNSVLCEEQATKIFGDSISVSQGTKEFYYALNIENNPGISGFTIALSYDKETFSVVAENNEVVYEKGSFSNVGSYSIYNDVENGKIKVLWANSSNVKSDGSLFKIKFNIDSNAKIGIYDFKISYDKKTDIINDSYESIDTIKENGTVTINEFKSIIFNDEQKIGLEEEFEYVVKIKDNPGIASYGLDILFDYDAFEPIKDNGNYAIKAEGFEGFFDSNQYGDIIKVVWADTKNNTQDGTLFTIKFKAKKGIVGEKIISISESEDNPIIDAEQNDVDIDFEINKIFIEDGNGYRITYFLNGGKNNSLNPSRYSDKEDIRIYDPTKDYYEFQGWYVDSEYKNKIEIIEKGTTGDLTLYALWSPISYIITYNLNGGALEKNNQTSYTIESNDVIINNPIKKGYTFVGWSGTDLVGNENTNVIISKGSSGDREYIANYKANKYKVTFDSTLGKCDIKEKEVTYDSTYGELPTPTTDENLIFNGWYLNYDKVLDKYSIKVDPETLVKIEEDSILYASWSSMFKYDIKYHNTKDVSNPNPKGYNGGITLSLIDLEKEHYDFFGWYSSYDETLDKWGTKVASISSKSKGDVNLYARWQLHPYTITYENIDNVDNSLNPSTYTYEDEVVLKDALGSYNNFLGWYTDPSLANEYKIDTISVHSSGDITLYAKWNDELKYQTNNPVIDTYILDEGFDYMTVDKGTRVAISCDTPESIIYYTTDNTDPIISENNLYEDTIEINDNLTIKALSVAIDNDGNQVMKPSNIVTYNYHIKQETSDIIENAFDRKYYNYNPDKCTSLWVSDIDLQAKETNTPIIYTGKPITPTFRVYDHTTLLKQGTDYTVKYSNNTNASVDKEGNNINETKLPTITITGKGNYAGSIVTNFTINKKAIELNDIPEVYLVYSTKGVSLPAPKVTFGNTTTLKKGTDYNYTIKDIEGTKITEQIETDKDYTVTISSLDKSNYIFEDYTYKVHYQIPTNKLKISSAKITGFVSSFVYTGSSIEQDISLTYGKTNEPLTLHDNYEVTYLNNTNIGTATMVINGINDYYGSITKTFKITGIALSKAKFYYWDELTNTYKTSIPPFIFTGSEIKPSLYKFEYQKDRYSEVVTLDEGIDYTVTYQKNIDKGTATIVFTGINSYTGTVKKTFKINPLPLTSLSSDKLTIELEESYVYEKGGVKPLPTVIADGRVLVLNKDYTLSYKNNTAINDNSNIKKITSVTIKGKGNYSGILLPIEFKIVEKDISTLSITVPDKAYQKKANIYKSTPTIIDTNGKKLASGTDYNKNIVYTYEYDTVVTNIINKKQVSVYRKQGSLIDSKDIIPVNTVIRATVTGIKNYEDSISTTYNIIPSDISKASVKIPSQYYTGKPIYLSKSQLEVKIGKIELEPKDYDIISYTNNLNKGSASVTIKGKGNYGGTRTIKFTITTRTMNFTIHFDKNNASATGTMKDMSINKSTKLTKYAFKRTGYSFVGWNTEKDGSGKDYGDLQLF